MKQHKKKYSYTTRNRLKIIRGGSDYFDCLETIADNARYSLHLQTYIFDEDETGTKIAAALMRAARRNVYVYVLLDGYASGGLSSAFVDGLKAAGVHFHFFEPFLRGGSFYIGRRLHHKVMVADASACLVAGINISNRYNDINGNKAWLDWAMYAEGEVAAELDDVCVKIWNRSAFRKKCLATEQPTWKLPEGNYPVRVLRNDWVYRKTEITRRYYEMFPQAKTGIIIMTSYFWPPKKLLAHIAAATARGINVKLVLTAKSDVTIAKYAERYLYPWLLRNNVEVYEYQDTTLHGKIAVWDNEWLTVGSYNVNNISAFASVELNLDIKSQSIASDVTERLQQIIGNNCKRIEKAGFEGSTNLLQKFIFFLSYRIVHIMFYLFTFYFVQKRRDRKGG